MSRIYTNVASLGAQHALAANQNDVNTRLQRLSTGLKINAGKDAPAGLIASEGLRSEIHGITQAIDNTSRANNVINTAEGALSEVSNLLLQLQSLTNESANTGGLSRDEIRANQLQADSILNSINRIAGTTEFNGEKLLNGSLDYITSGIASTAIDAVTLNAVKFPDNGSTPITVEVTNSAKLGEIDFAGTTVGTSALTIEVAGNTGTLQLSFAANTATSALALAVNQVKDSTGVSAIISGGTLRLTTTDYGTSQFVSVKTITGSFVDARATGEDVGANINGNRAVGNGLSASVRQDDFDVDLKLDKNFAQNPNTTGTQFSVTGGGAKFQIGSRVTSAGQIHIGIAAVTTTDLGNAITGRLSSIETGGENSLVDGSTVQAQKVLTLAIQQVATIRGRLGALQKDQLETNANSLQAALENVTASESAIRDADFADETSKLTRAQILVQSGTTVLAQANSSPQTVLSLLGR